MICFAIGTLLFFGYTYPLQLDYNIKHKFDIKIMHDPLGVNDFDFDYFFGVYLSFYVAGIFFLLHALDVLKYYPTFKQMYFFCFKSSRKNFFISLSLILFIVLLVIMRQINI